MMNSLSRTAVVMLVALSLLAITDGSLAGPKCGSGCPSSGCAAKPAAPTEKAAEITTEALATLLNAGTAVTVLDARSGKYDDGRRIPGAGNLSAKASEEEVAEVIPSKAALVVTYCTNLKCPASNMLAEHLRSLGYSNVIEYPHGIDGWAAAGQEVQQSK